MRKNNKGFTMAELLIVVAIIAVLVAVSIPTFTAALEKSREATDIANMRDAYAAGVAGMLSGEYDTSSNAKILYYDATSGVLKDSVPTGYGKGKADNDTSKTPTTIGNDSYTPTQSYENQFIGVLISESGDVYLAWSNSAMSTSNFTSYTPPTQDAG